MKLSSNFQKGGEGFRPKIFQGRDWGGGGVDFYATQKQEIENEDVKQLARYIYACITEKSRS